MKTPFTLLFLFLGLQLMSQVEIDRQVITSFGTSTNYTSATLGETIIGYKNNGSIQITSGFQQLDESTSVNVIDLENSKVEIKAFPNPYTDHFSIAIDDPSEILELQFIDIQGRSIYQRKVDLHDNLISFYHPEELIEGLTGIVILTKSNKRYLAGWIMKAQ